MLKFALIQRAATCSLALILLTLPAFGQRIARSRSGDVMLSADARGGYFPLAPGNSWTYQVDRLGPVDGVTIEVGDAVEIDGVTYFSVRGLGGAASLLRTDSAGRVFQYRTEERREALWFDFAAPVGGMWTPELPGGCTGEATLASRNQPVSVPAGTFRETATIQYGPSDCADAGVTEDVFAAGVGLLRRTEITIAGPRTMSLARARVNGRTIEGTGLSFSVRIDQPSYTPNMMPPVEPGQAIPVLKATAMVENSSNIPLEITFPSPQLFDLSIRNAAGETVYTWSADKLFPAVITEVKLGRRVFETEVPLGSGREPWAPGVYILEAWLTKPDGKAFSASVGFEITEPAF